MIRRGLILVVLSLSVHAVVTLEIPRQNELTQRSTTDIVLSSDVNQGFYLLNNELVPIRYHVTIKNYPLTLGENTISMSILDPSLKLVPTSRTNIQVYRTLPMVVSMGPLVDYMITELAVKHQIQLIPDATALGFDSPVLKRQLYAILGWGLIESGTTTPVIHPHTYDDMVGYEQYLALYSTISAWLPPPIHQNFYPNAYVTREEFINLLLLILNGTEQVSTSWHLTPHLKVPAAIKSHIPSSWMDPLAFVSLREAIYILINVIQMSPLESPQKITIQYPSGVMVSGVTSRWSSFIDWVRKTSTVAFQWGRNAWPKKNDPSPRPSTVAVGSSRRFEAPPLRQSPSSIAPVHYRIIRVQPGDSIQKIARRYYGNASKWVDLVSLNQLSVSYSNVNGKWISYVHIVPGQRLKVPQEVKNVDE
ncbi:MAG: LysM peptidoglycan-binding domain-containing protein [Candidatus Marinamargulisbacteria bacterium]